MLGTTPVARHVSRHTRDLLLCTDAAAEGLNFQFCGALVNYDMPWNPMRVEQRIGRIDGLGQRHPVVQIVNLHDADTVEADVYDALRKRINLFQSVVGRLQPILAQLPRAIADVVLRRGGPTPEARERVASELASRVEALEHDPSALDLDALTGDSLEVPRRPAPALDLAALGAVLRRPDVMPADVVVRPLDADVGYLAPGMPGEVRVTTDAAYFEQHADSVELWSPGSPLFPDAAELAGGASEPAERTEPLASPLRLAQ